MPAPVSALAVLLSVALFGAGCAPSFRDCSVEDASAAEALPLTLADTGLYDDIGAKAVSAAAVEFKPQFPLWTDGADKRRWLLLPAGTLVDTSANDDWAYPVGTKLFKEFSLDGVRLETRMNVLTETGWTGAAYIWDDAEGNATRATEGAANIAGTAHDVPNAGECLACHGGRRNFTLGFSATQLDDDARQALFASGQLSHESVVAHNIEPELLEGLGVLHGNCAHCHNADRDAQPQSTQCYAPWAEGDEAFDFTLPAELDDVYNAPALRTAADQLGVPGESKVLRRMGTRNLDEDNPSMPPLGTEVVDDDGVQAVEALLARLNELAQP